MKNIKISDLLFEDRKRKFTTREREIDPETGTVTWDVNYSLSIELVESLEKAYRIYTELLEEFPEDKKLEGLYESLKYLKSRIKSHLTIKRIK